MAQTSGTFRIRRPSWRDPRLGVGVLLVAASVALGSWVVAQAGSTVEAYAAADVLVPGQSVTADDLAVVHVQVTDLPGIYLTPEHGLDAEAVALRTVGAGELLPAGAIGGAGQVDLRPVTIPTAASAASALVRGGQVDIWVARPDAQGAGGARLAPEELLTGVPVAQVLEDTALFAGSGQVYVQVLVPGADLAAVLEALSSGAEMTLVPGVGG